MIERKEGVTKEGRMATHERITETAEVGAIFHFFGENVGRVASSLNMFDGKCFIRNPFADRIFTLLHMTSVFACSTVGPVDTRLVIIENSSSASGIWKNDTTSGHTRG
jgi:hypothetical protein